MKQQYKSKLIFFSPFQKEISTYGSKTFNELPESEKEKYKAQYKLDLKEYTEKKAELFKICPDLVKKRVKKIREKKVRPPAKAKIELPYITPFMVFREELAFEGKIIKLQDAQGMYRNMSEEEKMKYIQKLMLRDTNLEKQFSALELKIIKNSNGMPQRPVNAYNRFIRDLCQEKTVGDKREILKTGSLVWKTMNDEKKKKYEDEYKKDMEVWQRKMEEWFKTLPVEQRAEHMAKHGFLAKVESTKKRRRETTILEFMPVVNVSSTSKKQKTSSENETIVKKEEPKEKAIINIINASTPKKKQQAIESDVSSIDSPSKKKKFKNTVESFGQYPSLTTAHYFMSQKYSGKPKKVMKAYNKLSKSEKKKLYQEMKNAKVSFFKKLKSYAEENSKDADKIRKFHEQNRNDQAETVDWHIDAGTDRSDDSDESDSSESS